MRSVLQSFPPSGDAGANQLHQKLRRIRWDRQFDDFPLFARLRSCNHFLDLDTLYRCGFFQLCNTGSAITRMHAQTDPWLYQPAAGSSITLTPWFIDCRRGVNEILKCGKLGRNRYGHATQFNPACQTTKDKGQGFRSRKSRRQQSLASLLCFFRVANQLQQPPIQALLKV